MPPVSNKLKCCGSKQFSVWLVNETDSDVETKGGGELFGFNIGQFSEKSLSWVLNLFKAMQVASCN